MAKMVTRSLTSRILALAVLAATAPAMAEMRPTLSFSGTPGLLDMPSGDALADGLFAVQSAHFGPVSRTTLSFQISPRLMGSFRYTGVRDWDNVLPALRPTYYDRNFDLRYQLAFEGKYRPAIVVGLNDVVGTGLWASEYIAATKTFNDRVKVTAGLGWGRLASFGAVGAPFGVRGPNAVRGGTLRSGTLFRGDVAPFAGIEWQVNDRLGLKAEYSTDAYATEAGIRQTFDRKSPFNFGVEYQVSKSMRLGASYMYGSQLGLTASFVLNPKSSPNGGLVGNTPPVFKDRPPRGSHLASWSGEWVQDAAVRSNLASDVAKGLRTQRITLESITTSASVVEVRIRVPQGENSAQVIGRTVRILSATMPASVERFEVVPVANGLPLSKVVLARSDLEALDHAAGQDALIRQRSQILSVGAASADAQVMSGLYPKFTYTLAPYVRTSVFDPDAPFRADLGARFSARYEISPGLELSGSFTKKIVGNLDQSTRVSNSVIEKVRSNSNVYDKFGDPAIEHLTLAWYAKPAPNIYSRVTVGYLERMFGGVSAEVLWKPVDRPYAIGAELNYVKQRDFDQLFGFQNYEVVTGHVSGYYSFDNGIHAQLDVGRYLAGDLGATLILDREFANGWSVGAFATLTDVSFSDFGEGSFDKGIRVKIPMTWITGKPNSKTVQTVLRPVLRDGGARLQVNGRLYDTVRSYDAVRLDDQWGRFWR